GPGRSRPREPSRGPRLADPVPRSGRRDPHEANRYGESDVTDSLLPAERRARFLDRLLWLLPFGFYVPLTLGLIAHYLQPGDAPGYDGWLYREAAATFLAGGDPWSVGASNAHFPG